MSFARSTTGLNFIGTDETTGTAIANNATASGSELDVLGDNTSIGDLVLYAVITSTVAVGTIDITLNQQRVTGAGYAQNSAQFSIAPINGTQKIKLGRFPATRYASVTAKNNATGASATVAILGELYKAT